MYVFDSCILIEFLRGRLPKGLELLENTDSRLIKIPSIVQMELLVGAQKSKNPERTRDAVERLLVNFDIVPFDSKCAMIAAQLRATLEQRGLKIGSNDCIVAATALAHHAILVTNNVREFKRVSNLRLMSLGEVDS